MQVDIDFSDVVTPAPSRVTYPTVLDQPAGTLMAYHRESAIAEKCEAMVKLGEFNSRMKDFFDIWLLASRYEFDGVQLAAAIRATFGRRRTELEIEPVAFTAISLNLSPLSCGLLSAFSSHFCGKRGIVS
jgi:hypothetical protein